MECFDGTLEPYTYSKINSKYEHKHNGNGIV